MKYRIIAKSASLLLVLAMIVTASGIDSRLQRWNDRSEKLGCLKSSLDSSKILPLVTEIISGGIDSSEGVKRILERYAAGDGSLKAETKKYPLAEIERLTRNISSPVVNLYYLALVNRWIKNTKYSEEITAFISSCASSGKLHFNPSAGAANIPLVRSYIMEMSIGEYASFSESWFRKILGKTEYELSRTDYNSNDIDIERIIITTAIDECEKSMKETGPVLKAWYLECVPEWKVLKGTVEHESAVDRAAEKFALKMNVPAGDVKGRSADYIAGIIFSREKNRIIETTAKSTSSSTSGWNRPEYTLPDLNGLLGAIDDMDRYRESLLKRIDGREDKNYSARVRKNNTGIVHKYTAKYEALFKREEARIAGIKKTSPKVIIYNEEIFFACRNHFNEIRPALDGYAELSTEFIETAVDAGRRDATSFIAELEYSSLKNAEYISFHSRLLKGASDLGAACDTSIGNTMKQAVNDSLSFVRLSLAPCSIPADIRRNMTADQLKRIGAINSSMRTEAGIIAGDIRRSYKEYIASHNTAKEKIKTAGAESEAKIAQVETDALFSFAARCSSAINSMERVDSFLKEYGEVFETIRYDIMEKGASSRYYAEVDSGSILNLVTRHTAAEAEKEALSRDILAREGMDSLSGAVTLCRYYSKRGIKIEVIPSEKEIEEMRRSFSLSPEIQVSSWKMNGSNFRHVDLYCTAALKKIAKRRSWSPGENTESDQTVSISCPGIDVKFEAPPDWTVSTISCDNGSGVKLENSSRDCIIEIYALSEEIKILPEFSGEWTGRRHFTMVQKGWGKINEEDYFRTVCRDNSSRFGETRMFTRNGSVVIVHGVSPRSKARFINGVIEILFATISY